MNNKHKHEKNLAYKTHINLTHSQRAKLNQTLTKLAVSILEDKKYEIQTTQSAKSYVIENELAKTSMGRYYYFAVTSQLDGGSLELQKVYG